MSTARPECPPRVVYFGPPSSYTHQAACRAFGDDAAFTDVASVTDVFEVVAADDADYGVVPVENSTEGIVTMTFALFHRFHEAGLNIYGESMLPIRHHLVAAAGVTTRQIQRIYSHRQVLGQCRHWLQTHMPDCELVEVSSTPAAAAQAADDPTAAAIAGEMAADVHGLELLCRGIEDRHGNSTRFLILSKAVPAPSGDDRTSIMFATQDKVGALYDALLPFKVNHVNLSMIQSRPSLQKNWEYVFFVDFLGHATDDHCARALEELAMHCQFVEILGSYPRATPPAT